MKTQKLLSLLLCGVLLIFAFTPAFAAGQPKPDPTWQNTIESVTPVGDKPFVKLKLSPEGYRITECRLPKQYDVVFKDGTSTSVKIPDEPSHFAPLQIYETCFDVETPDGTVTLYAAVTFSSETKEAYFSVGQYMLDGTLGEDGLPAAGSSVYEFRITGETCESEIDEGSFIVRILHFFYKIYLKVQSWFVRHFGK